MRKLHKGLLIGGMTLAVLVPAGLVAADQIDMGNGNGRGNGSMNHECTGNQHGNQTGQQHGGQMGRHDGSGPMHADNTTANGVRNGNGMMNGGGNQARSGG